MKRILFTALVALSLFGCNKEQENTQTNEPHLLEEKCNEGDAESCFNLGNSYYDGENIKQDYAKAVGYYQKACDGGNATGCLTLGALFYIGINVKQDYKQAKEYYGKACDLGYQNGCEAYKELNKQGF
ncbi:MULTISPECIES: tetratricopeptide repeat protein [unclassified Helicobacter]|uniref:tetratricopeptide repeat protein n=1 Tax=unclassified Helicobacter TaxID=2593540 RepID=UPI001C6983A3|nr:MULTISPECIES: tetratricopeptide repeat protein [unclassified Helicobacter]